MNIIDKQDELITLLSETGLLVLDNTIDKISSFPCIILDIEKEEFKNIIGGVLDDKQYFHFYCFDSLENNTNSINATRKSVIELAKTKINALNCNIPSELSYGELLINGKRVFGAEAIIIIEV